MPDAVSDSSPLIHLAKIEALELISRLYSRILIPPAVWREVVEEGDGRTGVVEMQRAVRDPHLRFGSLPSVRPYSDPLQRAGW